MGKMKMGLSDVSGKLWVFLLAIYLWPGSGSWLLVVSGFTLLPEDVNLILPSIVKQGDDLTMYCHFDSKKFPQIYTVKWYKGNREFFRYTPKESPPTKPMNFGGIVVDEAQCDLHKVHLRKIPMMAGNITCEVTTDTNFQTVEKIKTLTVIVESETPPVLQVFPNNATTLRLLSRLILRCVSGPSKPAANITFFINDAPYNDPSYHSFQPIDVQYTQSAFQPLKFVKTQMPNESVGGVGSGGDKDNVSVGLETRKAEIQINLTNKYFRDNKIEIKCAATIYNVSQLYSDTYTKDLYVPPREATFSSFGNTNSGSTLSPGKLVWSITTTTTTSTTPITTAITTCVSVGKLVLFIPLNILLHQRQLIL